MFIFKNYSIGFLISLWVLLQVNNAWSKGLARIVNGEDDDIASVPSLVQLYDNGIFMCGGTLVSEYFVVTAAHCVEYLEPNKIKVKAGASTLLEDGIRANVSKVIFPKGWNMTINLDMDVAVVKLKEPFNSPLIQPTNICTEQGKDGDNVIVRGWGARGANSNYMANQLQSAKMFVVDKKKCEKMSGDRSDKSNTIVCVAVPGKSICFGDSGGPAFVNGKFCGVASFTEDCGTPGFPEAYTDLANPKVRRFLKNAMKQ